MPRDLLTFTARSLIHLPAVSLIAQRVLLSLRTAFKLCLPRSNRTEENTAGLPARYGTALPSFLLLQKRHGVVKENSHLLQHAAQAADLRGTVSAGHLQMMNGEKGPGASGWGSEGVSLPAQPRVA